MPLSTDERLIYRWREWIANGMKGKLRMSERNLARLRALLVVKYADIFVHKKHFT